CRRRGAWRRARLRWRLGGAVALPEEVVHAGAGACRWGRRARRWRRRSGGGRAGRRGASCRRSLRLGARCLLPLGAVASLLGPLAFAFGAVRVAFPLALFADLGEVSALFGTPFPPPRPPVGQPVA